MNKKPRIFLLLCSSAFIGWMSGYNFDHRSFEVALWAGATIYLAVIISI